MKVENKNAHRAADKHYFFATHVRDGDGTGDDVVMLLLTDKELACCQACHKEQGRFAEALCNYPRSQ